MLVAGPHDTVCRVPTPFLVFCSAVPFLEQAAAGPGALPVFDSKRMARAAHPLYGHHDRQPGHYCAAGRRE